MRTLSRSARSLLADPATDRELTDWEAAGRKDGGRTEVLWHAMAAWRRGLGRGDCPFGDEAPVARRRWQWMWDLTAAAARRAGVEQGELQV